MKVGFTVLNLQSEEELEVVIRSIGENDENGKENDGTDTEITGTNYIVHHHDNNNCVANFHQEADYSRYLQEEASNDGEEYIGNFKKLTDGSGADEKNGDKGNEDQEDVESFMYRREEQMI
jgi:hypothetical protein